MNNGFTSKPSATARAAKMNGATIVSTKEPSKVVTVRVPESLPEKVRAATGMSFSAAIKHFFEPFVASLTTAPPSTDEVSHDDSDHASSDKTLGGPVSG